jgi:fibronectin-binding autotransporter adhesin
MSKASFRQIPAASAAPNSLAARSTKFPGLCAITFCALSVAAAADIGTWTGITTGTWNTTDTNWSGLAAGFPWDSTNGSGNEATFNTASLAATVSGPVFTNGITFTTGGSLTGSTINLAGTTPFISVASGQTGIISSIIAGSAGLNKLGTGTLTLRGANNFTGGLAVKAGTVQINTAIDVNGLGGGTVTIGDTANTGEAATLHFNGGGSFPTFTNALVSAGNGTNILGVTGWNPTFNGGLSLSNNLTIASNNNLGSNFNINGGVTGTGNIIVWLKQSTAL